MTFKGSEGIKMNKYIIYFNGIAWVCEIENPNGEMLEYGVSGTTPVDVLKRTLSLEEVNK